MNLFEKIYAKIKWLRIQPESVKVRYIWASTIVVFAIVVLLWVGVFRKYERKADDNAKNVEFIEEVKKIKDDLGSKIKVPDIQLPENSPEVSPSISPLIPPSGLPEVFFKVL